jgi:hypothetical protein
MLVDTLFREMSEEKAFSLDIDEFLAAHAPVETKHIFNNRLVQDLYNVVNSPQAARLRTTDEIRGAFLPYITPIINDLVAYAEATTWHPFSGVKHHIETGEKEFKKLDPLTSMCVSIYFYIYH